jgi:ABC-type sugar transport system ATPase subunit
MMVGREITEKYPKVTVPFGDILLEVENISLNTKVQNVNFKVRRGEILGIGGLVGSGRSELVETVFGINKADVGTVKIAGKDVKIASPRIAIKNRVALITEDRKQTGLNLVSDITNNVCMVALEKFSKCGFVKGREESIATDKYITDLKIKATSRRQILGRLSGGNQQKVVLAKWLLDEPEIIILDEPTRGIDVGSKRDIYFLIGELVKAGKAIIIISSEIPELMGLADRIMVMSEGRMTGELARKDFSQEKILELASKFITTGKVA